MVRGSAFWVRVLGSTVQRSAFASCPVRALVHMPRRSPCPEPGTRTRGPGPWERRTRNQEREPRTTNTELERLVLLLLRQRKVRIFERRPPDIEARETRRGA